MTLTENPTDRHLVDPRSDSLWADAVDQLGGSLFCSPPWIRAVAATYEFSPEAYVLTDDGIRAGFVFCHVSDLRGSRVVSFPFSDFCDPLVTDNGDWQRLTEPVLARTAPVGLRCLHNPLPAADPRFEIRGEARWHRVDVARSTEEIWNSLHASARKSVRKARSQNVEVRKAEHESDLRAFYDLHLRVRTRKYRLLAQPYQLFLNLWKEFAPDDRLELLLATHEGRTIAGVFTLEWGDTLYYKFNASDPAYLQLRPNDLLAWHGIAAARARGLDWFDFGISDIDQPGLIQYKEKYATDEGTVTFLRFTPPDYEDEQGRQAGELLGRFTDLLTHDGVTDTVSEAAGNLLYRYFC
jgi:CelD/BcsL family acetyltransferase involved in cellulose biosynthesis